MTKLEKDLLADVAIMAKVIHRMDVTLSVLIQTLHDQNLVDGFELKDKIDEMYDEQSKNMIKQVIQKNDSDDDSDSFFYPHFGPIGEA
jgi:16S rRNA C1402 (ribose-2'-O) methylase RsmI